MEISPNMNKISDPLEYIIWCCEQNFTPSSFDINNAKDELKRLKNDKSQFDLIGWSRINSRGDIYDLRVCYNPYLNEDTLLPIYSNREEFKAKYGKLSQ